jgi:hypothetical protein
MENSKKSKKDAKEEQDKHLVKTETFSPISAEEISNGNVRGFAEVYDSQWQEEGKTVKRVSATLTMARYRCISLLLIDGCSSALQHQSQSVFPRARVLVHGHRDDQGQRRLAE